MKAWAYRTTKHGYCVSEGVIDSCVDVDIEMLTDIVTDCDRCLWDVQKYLDTNYKGEGYVFQYEEIEIDLDKIFEKKSED